jgi:hypothetical protein
MTAHVAIETAVGLTINVLALVFAIVQSVFSWQCLVALKTKQRAPIALMHRARGDDAVDLKVGETLRAST